MGVLSDIERRNLSTLTDNLAPRHLGGAPTAEQIASEQSEEGQRLGLSEPESSGVIGEGLRGAAAGGLDLASSWARTFNAEGLAGWANYKRETNQQLGAKGGQGWAQYAMNVGMRAVSQNVPLIASTVATGGANLPAWAGRLGMALTVLPSTYGQAEEEIARIAPDLSPEERNAIALFEGAGNAALEVMLGPERALQQEVFLNFAKRGGRKSVANMIKSGLFKSGSDSFFKNIGAQIAEELIDENSQAIFSGMIHRSIDPDYEGMSMDEFWRMQMDTAIGAGFLSIGPSVMRANRMRRIRSLQEDLTKATTESDVERAISVNGQTDAEAYQRFNDILWGAQEGRTVDVTPLVSVYAQRFGRESANLLTTVLQNVSINMAKNDANRTPLDYLNRFNQVFLDIDLNSAQQQQMRSANNDAERLRVLDRATGGKLNEAVLSATSSVDEQEYLRIQDNLRLETESEQVTALVRQDEAVQRELDFKKPLAQALGQDLQEMAQGLESAQQRPLQEAVEIAEGAVPEGSETATAVADAQEALATAIESNDPKAFDTALDKLFDAHARVASDIDADGRTAIREVNGERRAVVVRGAESNMDEDTRKRMYALGLMQNGSLIITKQSLNEIEYALSQTEQEAQDLSLEAQERKTARGKLYLLLQQQMDENQRRRRNKSNHSQPLTDVELSLENEARQNRGLPDVRANENTQSRFYFSQGNEQRTIHGQYIPEYNLAIFYNRANPQDVVHEWVHHLITKDLLPEKHMRVLNRVYTGGDETPDEAIRNLPDFQEKVANAVEAYLIEGRLPDGADEQQAEALRFIGKVGKQVWTLVQDNEFIQKQVEGDRASLSINEEVRAVMDEIFTSPRIGEASELEDIVAQALHTSTKLGDQGTGGTSNSDTAERAGVSNLGPLFSERISPETDREYLDAVERGDMQAAQRMVDEAAKAAVYPNQGQEWDVSDISLAGGTGDIEGTKAWLTPEGKIVPLTEQTHNMEAYAIIHGESPKELLDRAVERFEEEIRERLEADGEELYPVVYVEGAGEIEVIVEDSYSSREVTDLTETEEQLLEKVSEASVLAYDRENIDSYEVLLSAGWAAIKQPRDEINVTTARPLNGPQRRNVTDFAIFHDLEIVEDVYGSVHPQAILRDESGNVIPLSERFNPESNSILFAERQAEAGDEPLFSVKSSQFVPNDELENLDAKKLRQQVYVRGLGDKDGLDLLAGGDRETLSRERLLEIIRSQPSVTRGDLNSKAHARFDMDYDELNRSQKDSVLRYVLSGYGSESIPQKMQELVDKGVDIAKNIVNTLESQPKDFHARSRGSGGPQSSSRLQRTKNEALIATKNWYSKFRDGIITGKLTDLHTIIDALTDGNPDHPLWTIKRIINAGVRRKHMRDRYMKTWLTENGYDKLNIPWKQRFDIGDPRHPSGTRLHDVLGIYAIVADTPTGGGIAPVQQIEVQTDKNTGQKGVFLKGTDNFRGNATALFLSNRDLSYGATLEEQVKNFNEMLRNTYDVVKGSEQARGFIKLVRNYSEKALGDINAVRESLGIDPIEGRQNYLLPMMREGGTFRVDDLLYEAMELSPSRESAGRNPTPFFKRRTEGARARPIYLNASDVFNRYQKQVDTYIAKKPTVMLSQVILKELENSGWFQDNEELGALETLYAIAEREKYWNGRADPTTYIDGVLGQLRGNTFRATLTGNLPSGLRQGVSFWDAMALLPASQVFEGVKQYVRMFGKIGQVMAQSGGDTSLLINPLESDIAYKTAEQLGSRHIHAFWQISAQDIISEGGSQGVWSKKIGAMSLQDWAGSMQRWHDSTTRMAIWWTAYQYKLNKEGATQEEAFRYAEDLTLRTQPAADISERVGLQTGPEWQRTLAMYQSQLLKRTQLYRTEIIRPMMREWNKGTDPIDSIMRVSDALLTGRAIPDGHGPIAKRFFFMSVMPSIALGMIMRGGPPKDWKQFANDMLMFNITAIPILGPLVSFKMMYGVFEESGAQVYYNFMNDVGKFIVQAMPGGEEMTVEDWVSDPLRFTQYIGFPKTIVRPALDWIRGEEMPEGITEIFSRYGFRFVDDDGEPLMAREQWEKFWDNVGALGD